MPRDIGLEIMIAGHDWSATSLSPRASWPAAAEVMVSMILGASQPMFVLWGGERTLVYNDAYVPLLGGKHPGALGRPFLEVWSEAADDLRPLVDRVFAGGSNYMDDIEMMLDRGQGLREAHFLFSHTPIRDGEMVRGLLCVCTETTEAVLARRESEENYRHAVELPSHAFRTPTCAAHCGRPCIPWKIRRTSTTAPPTVDVGPASAPRDVRRSQR